MPARISGEPCAAKPDAETVSNFCHTVPACTSIFVPMPLRLSFSPSSAMRTALLALPPSFLIITGPVARLVRSRSASLSLSRSPAASPSGTLNVVSGPAPTLLEASSNCPSTFRSTCNTIPLGRP